MKDLKKLDLSKSTTIESQRKKRLGQYFSGTKLGRFLAALAGVGKNATIIDPMSGSGDLLAACVELGASPANIAALEIDQGALRVCIKRLPTAISVLGSAFDPKTLGKLPNLQWDLVITNPPYVRYQRISKSSGKTCPLPGAIEIRNGLLSEIEMLTGLNETDKKLFKKLAESYSGLADLAVPSWILCAGLVAPGGRLALIVPESWLSRDYAAVVHYILLRWFEIEFVVEDEHASWFTDVQVKTTLIVAKRIRRRKSAFNLPGDKSFLKIVISGKATGPSGPCSLLWQGEKNPELSFARKARKWLALKSAYEDEMVKAFHLPLSRLASNLHSASANQNWFTEMGEDLESMGTSIPQELDEWLDRSPKKCIPVSLSSLGVSSGQGLRTGANSFFYGESRGDGILSFPNLLPKVSCFVPDDVSLPVIRKQKDLPKGFLVTSKSTLGRVLYLQNYALKKDIRATRAIAKSPYQEMPKGLANLVRKVGTIDFGNDGEVKYIWELSAVAPNIRKGNPKEGIPPRFWYMLPDFARRHRPDFLIARINTGCPKTYLNKDNECIIDANFVTLWIDSNQAPNHFAMLALLNSSWTKAALEYSAAVMGGGALKVEATHLRKLPVPPMTKHYLTKLSALGKKLSKAATDKTSAKLLDEIDIIIATAALGRKASNKDVRDIKNLALYGAIRRSKHKKKGNNYYDNKI